MKRIFVAFLLFAVATAFMAMPARRGLWMEKTTADGRTVVVELRGDEILHYWQDQQGTCYTEDARGKLHRRMDMSRLKANASARKATQNIRRLTRRAAPLRLSELTGMRRGLIILAEFADKQFLPAHDNALYQSVANASGYKNEELGFRGSLFDYFLAQSCGQLKLRFDVVGPIPLKHEMAYYGAETEEMGHDVNPGAMVKEACEAVANIVDFADYDWNGDGEAEQVCIIYAGEGQAAGGASETIWPHEWALREALGNAITIGGTQIDVYACSPELMGQRNAGIGSLCHEFAHCLGLPDLYDTSEEALNYGMGHWSVMDAGCYNGDGFCPCNFTSLERATCGWLLPEVALTNEDVAALKSLSDGGTAWMIENDNWPDECYLLENRQQTGWDEALPGKGLLVMHVDFDRDAWDQNKVNSEAVQRCTIFHADDETDDETGDLYPWCVNDSLTATSVPAATIHHVGEDGLTTIGAAIRDIRQNDDGTIDFSIWLRNPIARSDTLFYESFDKCASTGGNDGQWKGRVALGSLVTDNSGWSGTNLYGGNHCARVGNSTDYGTIMTPSFHVTGACRLKFRAAPWNDEKNFMYVTVEEGDAELEEPDYEYMANQQWTEYYLHLKGAGRVKLNIWSNQKRFFLDEVLVVKEPAGGIVTEVPTLRSATPPSGIFTLDGRRVEGSLLRLPHGIYIVNGKKIVK